MWWHVSNNLEINIYTSVEEDDQEYDFFIESYLKHAKSVPQGGRMYGSENVGTRKQKDDGGRSLFEVINCYCRCNWKREEHTHKIDQIHRLSSSSREGRLQHLVGCHFREMKTQISHHCITWSSSKNSFEVQILNTRMVSKKFLQ